MAWPIAVSTLSYSAMTLVGTAFVARVGAAEVAGVGLGGVVSFAVLGFGVGVLRGLKTLVSQAVGAGRRDEADRYLGVGVLMSLALGLLSVAVAEVLAPVIASAAADPAVGRHAATYLRVRAVAGPLVLVYIALRETRWGEGDARTPMRASVLGNLTNFALDVLLIVGLGWGVVGAAIATVAGNAVELARLAWPMRHRLTRVAWRPTYARAVWNQGVATGLQFLLEVGAFLLLTAIVARMSAADAAAHHLVLQLTHVSFLPAHALAESASVLAGNAVGAGRLELVTAVARRALALGAAYAALCTVAFVAGAVPIATLLAGDRAEVVGITATLVKIAALFLIADAANVIARAVLRGSGDVVYPAVVGVITAWVATPPTAWALGLGLGWGAPGAWLGLTAEIMVGTAILWQRLLGHGWTGAALTTRARMAAAGDRDEPGDQDSPGGHVVETLVCQAGDR